ncbi:MAG: response regulator, partial [Burkholderiales bacterium]
MDRAALAHLRHELRTPLNHIIGYSEMLLEDAAADDPAALEPGLRKVHEDAQRLLAAINELSHTDAGEVDLERLSAELAGPLNSVITTVDGLRLQAGRAGAERAAEDLERVAIAAAALQSVITNGVASPTDQPTTGTGASSAPVTARGAADPGVILVVDDNVANREMLGRRLEREGHQVQLAAGGREALELLRERRVDLVLLDVMMPEVDGYAVLQHLKADEQLRDVPVLMISAVDEIESVVRCIELGAEDYLPKPFDPVLLRARIGACLEKKRLRD